jgi:hypothetical protein
MDPNYSRNLADQGPSPIPQPDASQSDVRLPNHAPATLQPQPFITLHHRMESRADDKDPSRPAPSPGPRARRRCCKLVHIATSSLTLDIQGFTARVATILGSASVLPNRNRNRNRNRSNSSRSMPSRIMRRIPPWAPVQRDGVHHSRPLAMATGRRPRPLCVAPAAFGFTSGILVALRTPGSRFALIHETSC